MPVLLALAVTLALAFWLTRYATNSLPYRIALGLVMALLIVASLGPDALPFALIGLFLVLFGMAWLHEFRYLMELNDDAFPGRNDKLIWALFLMILPPVGAATFWSFRRAHWPESKPVVGRVSAELS
jgi:hypothetical protein